ncbi:hypothetical protein [Microcoleus vaginatus]
MRSVNDEEGRRKREEARSKSEEGRRKNKECLNFRLPIPDA